jgi:hypothetical protein
MATTEFENQVLQDLRQLCFRNHCYQADNYGCKDCWKMRAIISILKER